MTAECPYWTDGTHCFVPRLEPDAKSCACGAIVSRKPDRPPLPGEWVCWNCTVNPNVDRDRLETWITLHPPWPKCIYCGQPGQARVVDDVEHTKDCPAPLLVRLASWRSPATSFSSSGEKLGGLQEAARIIGA